MSYRQQPVVSPASSPSSLPTGSMTPPSSSGTTLFAKLLANNESSFSGTVQDDMPMTATWLTADNAATLPHGSIVRMRGFVQDMFDSEFYQPSTGKLIERIPVLVTPLPFSSPWFREQLKLTATSEQRQSKRMRMSPNHLEARQSNRGMVHKNDLWSSGTMGSDPCQVASVVYLYYEQYSTHDRVRLNDVVELWGILDRDEEGPAEDMDNNEHVLMDWHDDSGHHQDDDHLQTFPPSIPRVHVLSFERCLCLEDYDESCREMILDGVGHTELTSNDQTPLPWSQFAQVFGVPACPALSALYISLFSCAERETKTAGQSSFGAPSMTPMGTTLGCASFQMVLNDSTECNLLAQRLEDALRHLVPVVTRWDVSAASLVQGVPAKQGGRIRPHPWQLPKGAVLILNLGELESSSFLSPEQTVGLQALQTLVQSHTLDIKFDGGMKLSFEADWRILVLATPVTQKLLPCTLQAKYTLPTDFPTVWDGPNSALLASLRQRLTQARMSHEKHKAHRNILLSPELVDHAPRHFCRLREETRQQKELEEKDGNHKSVVQESDFSRWFCLVRLVARSRGSTVAQVQDWETAVALDMALS